MITFLPEKKDQSYKLFDHLDIENKKVQRKKFDISHDNINNIYDQITEMHPDKKNNFETEEIKKEIKRKRVTMVEQPKERELKSHLELIRQNNILRVINENNIASLKQEIEKMKSRIFHIEKSKTLIRGTKSRYSRLNTRMFEKDTIHADDEMRYYIDVGLNEKLINEINNVKQSFKISDDEELEKIRKIKTRKEKI